LPFWRSGIPVDVVHPGQDLSGYRLVIAPMLYMVKEDTAKALREYVERGGTFVTTFFTGMVGETDLCFRGGFPGPLRPLLGIWQEEIDGLYPEQQNSVQVSDEALGLDKTYAARQLCALIHAEGATVLGRYGADFYAGRPALTRHGVGSGSAYFIASRNDEPFLSDFYGALASRAGVRRLAVGDVPAGVTVQEREKDGKRYLFALNFTDQAARVELAASGGTDLVTGASVSSRIELGPYGCAVVEAAASAP
jgi:beta-galactosidase